MDIWHVTPCTSVNIYQRFGVTCYLTPQGSQIPKTECVELSAEDNTGVWIFVTGSNFKLEKFMSVLRL
jgi:hypothetical protein